MDIQFLVERLEATIVNARKLPLTDQVIVEQPGILDLIDQLRVAIPEEVRLARKTNQETERLLQRAREEAEQIISAAQEQAALLLQEQSILRQAETKAEEIEEGARSRADETMRGADRYAADVLQRLEGDLQRTLSIIKKSLDVLGEQQTAPPAE